LNSSDLRSLRALKRSNQLQAFNHPGDLDLSDSSNDMVSLSADAALLFATKEEMMAFE